MLARALGFAMPFAVVALAFCAGPAVSGDDDAPVRPKPKTVSTLGGELSRRNFSYSPWDRQTSVFSPDGKVLASFVQGQLRLWDVATGKDLGVLSVGNQQQSAVAISPDHKFLVTTGGNQYQGGSAVSLWDLEQHKLLRNLDDDVNLTAFSAVAFSPDGKTLALAGIDGGRRGQGVPGIHLWDVASGDELRKIEGLIPNANPNPRTGMVQGIDALAYSPDGRTLAVVSEHKVMLCEVATGKERCVVGEMLPTFAPSQNFGQGGYEDMPAGNTTVAFAPDGRLLAASSSSGLVYVWDISTGEELTPLTGQKGELSAIRFSSDGKSLLTLNEGSQIQAWSVSSLRRRPGKGSGSISESALSDAWDDLRNGDTGARYEAIRALAAAPKQAVPFLRERVKVVEPVESQKIAQLIADLQKEDFNGRKKAAAELRKIGDLALPAMQQAMQQNYDQVLQLFIAKLQTQYPTPEQVQCLYAVQALERMGGDDARKLLEELSKGAAESSLTKQATAAINRLSKTNKDASDVKLETLWTDLAGDDSARAFRAARLLSQRSKEALPMISKQLAELAVLDDSPERVKKLVGELDSNDFAERDRATKELGRIGRAAEKPLRKALDASPSLEAKERLETLLANIVSGAVSPDRLQAERAIEILEWSSTDDARKTLEQLGKDPKNNWLKDAVAGALKRMEK